MRDDTLLLIGEYTNMVSNIKNVASNLPTADEIQSEFPSEMGCDVIMEDGKTYSETIRANQYRKEGIKWLQDKINLQKPDERWQK